MGSLPKTKKKNFPKSISEMSPEMLQETLKKKKECNAKALAIVEKLCEPDVEKEWFLLNLQFINQTHFDDVTVERAITKLCGYPLCSQKLGKIPNQQYHISTKYNKVFDISERKNFCSGSCYKAAVYIKNQLFTSPLWFRDQEVIPVYKVLESAKPSLGEEVVFLPDKIKPEYVGSENGVVLKERELTADNFESEKTGSDDTMRMKFDCDNSINKEKDIEDSVKKKREIADVRILEVKCSELFLDDPKEKEIPRNKESVKNLDKETTTKTTEIQPIKTNKNNLKYQKKIEPVSSISKVEKSIFEWFSLETLFHLYNEDKIKNILTDKANDVKEILNSKLKMASSNDKIDRMIQLFGILDTNFFSSGRANVNLKPLPDYSVLKEEGKTLNIKVNAFYQGQLEVKKSEIEETKKEESACNDEPNYLPFVDSRAQLPLRRQIVLDKLNKIFPDLIKIFTTDNVLEMSEVRNLVLTFTLEAHNITFRPNEWYLVGIILIKLLSLKKRQLESLLTLESSRDQLSILLRSYKLQENYLEDIVQKLTDSANIMKKLKDMHL